MRHRLPTTPLGKAGLAAVILLAPGGFILGAGLLADRWRRRRSAGREKQPADDAAR